MADDNKKKYSESINELNQQTEIFNNNLEETSKQLDLTFEGLSNINEVNPLKELTFDTQKWKENVQDVCRYFQIIKETKIENLPDDLAYNEKIVAQAQIKVDIDQQLDNELDLLAQKAIAEQGYAEALADIKNRSGKEQLDLYTQIDDMLKGIGLQETKTGQSISKEVNKLQKEKGEKNTFKNVLGYAKAAKAGFDQVRGSIQGMSAETEAALDLTSDIAGATLGIVDATMAIGAAKKVDTQKDVVNAKTVGAAKASSGDIIAIIAMGLSIITAVLSFLGKKKQIEEEARKAEMKHRLDVLKAEQKQNDMVRERLFEEKQISKEKYQQAKENEKVNDKNKLGRIDNINSMVDKQVEYLDYELHRKKRSTESTNDLTQRINDLKKLKELANGANGQEELEGFLSDNKNGKEDQDNYKSLYNEALKEQEKWAEEAKKIQEEFIGATAQTFVDQWIEAFSAGEANAYDFSKNMQKVLRDSIIKGFAEEAITKAVAPVFASLNKQIESYLSGDKELSELDFSQSLKDVANANDKIKALAPELSKLIEELGLEGITDAAQGMTGAIQGMSQETATVLAGQFNAIRVSAVNIEENLKDSMDITRRSIEHLGRIAANTDRLEAIERSLKNIEYNL